jgi:hypothetical protein
LFLSQNPDEFAKLRAKPELVESMVPEIIRYQIRIAYMRRTALADVEFGVRVIHKGNKVAMWYISVNRDEGPIEEPDRFIIDHSLICRPARHSPLRRQEPGRNAIEGPVGRNPQPPGEYRGRRRAEAVFSDFIHGISELPVRIST